MSEFETSGSVRIEIDQQSLREARDEVETEIGSVSVSPSTSGSARTDGGRQTRRMVQAAQSQTSELETQTGLLEEIVDEIDDAGGGGGLGGGGGGGGGGSATPVPIGGGKGTGKLGKAAKVGKFAGAVGVGAGVGIAGVRALQETGVTEATRGFGESLSDAPGAQGFAELMSQNPATEAGAFALDVAGGSDQDNTEQVQELQEQSGADSFTEAITQTTLGGAVAVGQGGLEALTLGQADTSLDPESESNGSGDTQGVGEAIVDNTIVGSVQDTLFGGGGGDGLDDSELAPVNFGDNIGSGGEQVLTVGQQPAPQTTDDQQRVSGSGLSGGTGPVVAVTAPITIEESGQDIDRELDRRFDRLRQDILRQIPELSADISTEQQRNFRRGY